ncbi:PLDc N-terminal domain-containing protein [Kineococcus gynurae]|uniref:PLDc N-terminal domain-containing protein n=1 Tax=Kineococcus gynurae TaxID=452979 RepID=A0ABV5LTP9_9ACTN
MLRTLPVLIAVALTVYSLVSAVQAEDGQVRTLPRPLWILLILLLPVIGPIAYLMKGRPLPPGPRAAGFGGRPAPRGPDDDEDFLRKL